MKLLLLTLVIVLTISCSCMPVKDISPSPASLNHRRLIMGDDVGITTATESLTVRTYTSGTVGIQGLGECDFYSGQGYVGTSLTLDLSKLPKKNVCLFEVQLRDNAMDAPMIGMLLTRRFDDASVQPLSITSDGVSRNGVGWVQVNGAGETSAPQGGIGSDRQIILEPKGSTGTVYISGCGIHVNYDFEKTFTFNISTLYDLKKDCLFDILVNNMDQPFKEGASLFVGSYKSGSFLDAPTTKTAALGRRCFTFQDPYTGASLVNGHYMKGKKKNCVKQSSDGLYTVEGLTSQGRMFYGQYKYKEGWLWFK